MRNEYLLLTVLLAFAGLPRISLADESSAGISVGELSKVQSETFLYKAQAERAAALRAIDGAQTNQPRPYSVEPAQLGSSSEELLPVVELVYGSSRSLHATLLYSGGGEVDAQVGGQELPGGYKAGGISLDSVVLTRNGKRYPLAFSTSAPSNRYQGTSSRVPVSGLPGISMGQPAPITLPGQP
jgi:type IV pilus biogenesis protein PilP